MNKTNLKDNALFSWTTDLTQIIDKIDGNLSKLPEAYKLTAEDVNILKEACIEIQTRIDTIVNQIIDNSGVIVNFATGELISDISILPVKETGELNTNVSTKDYVDEINIAVNEDIINLNAKVDSNKSELDNDISELQEKDNSQDIIIDNNTQNIGELQQIIANSFATFGQYRNNAGTLDGTTAVRPNLIEVRPLNEEYVSVQLSPNNFTNNQDSKIRFVLSLVNINNSGSSDLTLQIVIYKGDGTLIKTIDALLVPAGEIKTVQLSDEFNVFAGDEVYYEYAIKEGTGSLSTDTQPTLNIEVTNLPSGDATLSGDIQNDKLTRPISGINTDLNKISINESNILTLQNQLNDNYYKKTDIYTKTEIDNMVADLQDQLDNHNSRINRINTIQSLFSGNDYDVTLSESYKNFRIVQVQVKVLSGSTIGYATMSIATANINSTSQYYFATPSGSSVFIIFNSNTNITSVSSTYPIINVYGINRSATGEVIYDKVF